MKHCQFVIVGGGPAGSTLATLLSQAGKEVLLVEREHFPRPHVGESLLPFCYQIFEQLGVLEQLEKTFFRKPGVRFNGFHGRIFSSFCFSEHIKGPGAISLHVRRDEFDHLLLKNASKKGVKVMQPYRMTHFEMEDEGITVTLKGAEEICIKASFLIDASGRSAVVASGLGIRRPIEGFDRIAFSAHWEGAERIHGIEEGLLNIFDLSDDNRKGWIWMIPISDERVSIGLVVDNGYFKKHKAASENDNLAEGFYLKELLRSELIRTVLLKARMSSSVEVNGDYSYSAEHGYGKHFALVGDAYRFVDPIFATGVFMGMKSAQVVAHALIHDIPLERAYRSIDGAYGLVERMIRYYYDDNSIDFHALEGAKQTIFGSRSSSFRLVHGLLAGDFFESHERYHDFLDQLFKSETLKRYYHLSSNHGGGLNRCN